MMKRPLRSLTEIARVDWSRAGPRWSCGDARGVPDSLLQLASPNSAVRDRAWKQLSSVVYHQGNVYQCTAEVIPFLFDIAARSDSHELEVLDFLCLLAEDGSLGRHAEAVRVRELLVAGVEAYLCALRSDNSQIREVAAAILGSLPEARPNSAVPLAAAITTERDARALATEIWALGALLDTDPPKQLFGELFHHHADISVRAVVASFLVKWAGGSVDEALIRAVADGQAARLAEDLRVPFDLLEASLHCCALGGQLLQQINTGRYR